ncbi:hypothetical protein [Nitrincola sp. MINF-07-Sa-05]|uniref:hypothetical protein n=1 Tax=Nitrincola salilacus TaxID=3400273 RepID=UPI003917C329
MLFLLLTAPVLAQTYVVGVEDLDYLPYYSSDQGEFVQSPSRQVLDRFAAQHQYEFVYTPVPVARLTQMFVDGNVDFKFPDHPDWAQTAKTNLEIHYSSPIFHYTDGVMVLPEHLERSVDQFKTLGTVRGFSPPVFAQMEEQGLIQIEETSSLDSVVLQALYNRVDGTYFNIAVATWFLEERIQQPRSLIFDPSLPHTSSHYALSSIHHPDIIEQFNHFLIKEAVWIESLQPMHPFSTSE